MMQQHFFNILFLLKIFILLLVVLCHLYKYKYVIAAYKNNKVFKFLTIYCILVIAFYSIYMYNLGLASRMRVMFWPFFLLALGSYSRR